MGVVNVTPDSFSDGGVWFDPEAAIAHGLRLWEQGADIIDVGGESTRPGALRPDEPEEMRRILRVVAELAGAEVVVSIDTMRAAVAQAAVASGARIVNDVSGALGDPAMAEVVAAAGVDFVAMHWRGHSVDMQSRAHYDDVVADVCRELAARVAALTAAGVAPERIILDPGLGFAKLPEHNWALLRALPDLVATGHRVLVGSSRKRFLGLAGRDEQTIRPADARDIATAVTSAYAADAGVWGVRVHDVVATRDALAVRRAWRGESEDGR
ncbi:MAG: dihydropteroate synthase [Tetrasphaera sp.]